MRITDFTKFAGNLEYKQEKKIIFKLHLHSIWSFRRPAKPLFMGFSAIFQAIQTPDRQYGVLTHIDDFKGFLTS